MKVFILSEEIRSPAKVGQLKGNQVRLQRLMKAAQRGDTSKTHAIKGLKRSVKDRARFMRFMYRD